MATKTSKYAMSARVVGEKLDIGMALSVVGSNRLVILNRTGGEIWELLDGSTSLETLISQLASKYGKTPDAITAEVIAVVDQLLMAGLIVEKWP